MLGSTKLLKNGEDVIGNQQLIRIQDRINHPDYMDSTPYNDIALLRLSWSAILNEFVRPACLPPLRGAHYKAAVASGWGNTNPGKLAESNFFGIIHEISGHE